MSRYTKVKPGIKIEHNLPRASLFAYFMARIWRIVFSWKFIGEKSDGKKYLLIAAPHTDNWDVPHMLAAAYYFRVKLSFMLKHTWFRWPAKKFLKSIGGIPIDRSSPHGFVDQAVQAYNNSERLVLTISPPGTRKKTDYWKSGFYRIALKANIPIICGFLDYGKREAGIGPPIELSGDVNRDMDKIREFYKDIKGKYPERMTRIRLREEDQ